MVIGGLWLKTVLATMPFGDPFLRPDDAHGFRIVLGERQALAVPEFDFGRGAGFLFAETVIRSARLEQSHGALVQIALLLF